MRAEIENIKSFTSTVKAPNRPMRTGVLIVDDEPQICKYAARLVDQQLGVNVLVCHSAEDALAIMHDKHARIGVILSDIRMPGRDGRWLIHQVREQWPGTVCLAMTAYAGEECDEADDVIYKPWESRALVRAINLGLIKAA